MMMMMMSILYSMLYCFHFAWLYGAANIVDYLMPDFVYEYISNIYNLLWLGFMAYKKLLVIQNQILFIHSYYMFLNKLELIFFTQLNGFIYV